MGRRRFWLAKSADELSVSGSLMGGEHRSGAAVLHLESLRETRATQREIIPVESEQSRRCHDCRSKLRQLTEFVHLAAEIADELT